MIGKLKFISICLVAVGLLALAARKIRLPYPMLQLDNQAFRRIQRDIDLAEARLQSPAGKRA